MTESHVDTAEHRVTITIADAALPTDEADREFILDTVADVLAEILREHHDVGSRAVDWTLGYQYAQVGDECPRCGEPLERLHIHMDDANGAYATATCPADDCPWSGDAIYRIIDLEEATGDGWTSAVRTGQVEPAYCSYE